MTDKQIIVDGVDVNALYSDQIACMNRYEVAHLFIKTVEQLKRKEQELEALYKVAKTHLAETFEMQKEIDQLKSENKELIRKNANKRTSLKKCNFI